MKIRITRSTMCAGTPAQPGQVVEASDTMPEKDLRLLVGLKMAVLVEGDEDDEDPINDRMSEVDMTRDEDEGDEDDAA